ncbi:MAG TPA: ABC transporter permease [Chitinophagaceae bacterium]|nr:ABC transporter permease [Chitinophagaceae bacterium]
MIKNYFKIAFRHLLKSKLYAFVNIIGLAIGITSCLLIGIYIWDELSYDRFHKNADRTVRVTWEYYFGEGETNETANTGTKVGPQFQRTFPEVEAYVRLMKYPRVIAYNNQAFDEKNFLYADSSFFTVFSFPLLKGDAATALDAPDKLVLTQSMAKKYFGNEEPIGKTVNVGGTKDFVITGIASDAPQNSQIKFDFVGSFKSLGASKEEKWSEANYTTFLLLKDKQQVNTLQQKINNYMKGVNKEEMKLSENHFSAYHIEPFTKVHLHSKLDGFEPNNSITYIYILGAVALLILLIACVNYTNLSTAQSAGRSAEIGMRKVMGAHKKQVFTQFITESLLLTLFAIFIAVLLAVVLLPYFNQLSGKDLPVSTLFLPQTLIPLLTLSVIVAITASAYPALILSNSKVIQVLKSGFTFTGSNGLRKSLIVLQFIISIFLIITTIVILQQLSYIQNKDLGYSKEHIVVLPVDRKTAEKFDDIKSAFENNKGVVSIAGAYEEPTHIGWSDGINTKDNKSISVNAFPVDEDIVKTLDLKIIEGSDYNETDVKQFDTSNNSENLRYTFMLNEAAVNALGWTPKEAIGKTIIKGREGVIKAVVKDFHFRSLHEPINPLLIFLDKRLVGSLFVKLSGNDIAGSLKDLEKTWKERIPHRPFQYHFLDEDYDALYKTEQRTAGVFTTFSTLAILLACLGLFALTAYTMVRRTKEIGIRKILGASIPDILTLVSKDFIRLVLLAVVIAVPIAWYAVNTWLEGFTYKIRLEWWVFAAGGIITLIIAFITICMQAIKTALTNPVKNLRTE